jgi:hypothetical protein
MINQRRTAKHGEQFSAPAEMIADVCLQYASKDEQHERRERAQRTRLDRKAVLIEV